MPDFQTLKAKQRKVRGGFPDDLALRVHRSLSWYGRATEEKDDIDVHFILLWIGFNSAYAAEISFDTETERSSFGTYLAALVSLDEGHRIYNAIWQRFSNEVRLLLDNKYVFAPFWKHQNGVEGYADWEVRLAASRRAVAMAMGARDTSRILSIVFDRLYMLRNQIVHGGSTWNSSVNRDQVRDGAAVLGNLLPIFIDIMMDHPREDWGRPFYPVTD